MILAVDPGLTGALSWLSSDGTLVEVADMPVAKIRDRNRIVASDLAHMFRLRTVDYVVIEAVGPHRGDGAGGAFAFGYGAGLLEGVASALEIPVHLFSPATWKKRAGVPADKNGARVMASRLWPGAADRFRRVKDDGRAESALLGRWAVLGGVR